MNRRKFSKKISRTIISYALLDDLFIRHAFTKPVYPIIQHWLLELQEYCLDLRKTSITPLEWQCKVEELYQHIELNEILKYIDFDRLFKGFKYPDLGVHTKPVQFPKLEGLPANTAFVKKIFGMKKDRAIIPHGHTNMASAHLLIKGDMHLRHYEKIRHEDNFLIIQPTVDKFIGLGDYSSVSDDRDNVHWFVANSETAFTFDVIMLDLGGQSYDIQNLDIYEKEDLKNGQFRVPILDVETALKKYGKLTHH